MKARKTMRRTLSVLILGLAVTFGSTVYAQDVSRGARTRTTTQGALDEAARRVEQQTQRLDEREREESGLDTESRLTLGQVEDEARKMTAEQIEQIKRQLEQKNRRMIQQLDEIIARDPYNAQKPNWMFQKAELLWELRNMEYLRVRTEYNQCVDAAGRGTADESGCAEPQADYAEAQAIYEEILRQYPDYNRLDEVIYRLGRGLIDAGKGAQAVGYLQRLVSNYPNSRYIPEAHLALGEFFFEQQMTGAARDNYLKVLEHKNYNNYDYALYKLGWVYYNLGEWRDAVNTFISVVERTKNSAGFQNQAINDLVVAFSQLDNGWLEAREYFLKNRGQEFTYDKIGQMAILLETQGKEDQSISIYEWFLQERPNHRRAPDWMHSIVASKRKLENFPDLEATMNRFVAYLHPNGTWFQHNGQDEGPVSNANLLVEGSLAFLANHYHRQAQRLDAKPDYVTATKYYKEFIERFPNNPASFDMNFFLGEIYLHALNDYESAARQYQHVVDLYKNNNVPQGAKQDDVAAIVRDSAFAVVNAYNELVKQHHPDSILVEMAQREERNPGGAAQALRDQGPASEQPPIPRTDLLPYELGFVRASDQFSEMYPKEDITPTVDFVAAEVYKSRGHYDSCVPRYESIIINAPRHRYASFAGNSLLEANYRLQNWDEVEKWARHLLANKIFDVTPEKSLQSAIAFAINQRAIGLKDNRQFDRAATELLRLAEEFPKSELAPGALFNAAAIYEAGDEINRAVEIYERLVKEYPTVEQAPEALFVMGAIFESRADFDRAASYFERLGTPAYKDSERSADAVYNAAVLREAMEQWDKAIATYEQYLSLYPGRDNALDVEFNLAFLEKERENFTAAQRRFEAFSKKPTTTPSQQIEISLELGLLAERLQPRNWEQLADGHFTKAVTTWQGLPEEEKVTAKNRYMAAHARFRQAEAIFEKFRTTNIVAYPEQRLVRTLTQKGEYQQEAEKIYAEIIQMQSPRWVAASAYRIGQTYKNFSDELYALPIPPEVPEDMEDIYRMQLDEYAFPLQERALTAFRRALNLALQFQAYNEWSSLSAQEISRLESEAFPITSQDGVAVEHGRINFFPPEAIKALEVVVERGSKRKERLRPPAPPAEEDGGEVATKPGA
jgi:cellulose synthase operon protein C